MHQLPPIRLPHRVLVLLLGLPPLIGLVVLAVPDNEVWGGLMMLGWPLPVLYLSILRRWGLASLVASAMAVVCLAGLGWVLHVWERTGCMYGFIVMGAVPALGGGALLASLCGLISAALGRRRQQQPMSRIGWIANSVILVAALIMVLPLLIELLPSWTW
jgi:hypothetical protein